MQRKMEPGVEPRTGSAWAGTNPLTLHLKCFVCDRLWVPAVISAVLVSRRDETRELVHTFNVTIEARVLTSLTNLALKPGL